MFNADLDDIQTDMVVSGDKVYAKLHYIVDPGISTQTGDSGWFIIYGVPTSDSEDGATLHTIQPVYTYPDDIKETIVPSRSLTNSGGILVMATKVAPYKNSLDELISEMPSIEIRTTYANGKEFAFELNPDTIDLL